MKSTTSNKPLMFSELKEMTVFELLMAKSAIALFLLVLCISGIQLFF